jgi:hypothetical protein
VQPFGIDRIKQIRITLGLYQLLFQKVDKMAHLWETLLKMSWEQGKQEDRQGTKDLSL